MRMQTSMALSPRALRRNRILLAAFIVAAAPVVGLVAGVFTNQPYSGPLLLSIDEMPIDRAATDARSMLRDVRSNRAELQAGVLSSVLDQTLFSHAFVPQPVVVTHEPAAAIEEPLEATVEESESNVRWFNGRPIRPVRTLNMVVTAYSPDEQSCGESADGITASGLSVWTNGMKLAAADTSVLPFGSMISVPGYDSGQVVPVLDRGGAIKGNRLDMLYPTHEQARQWGVQRLEVTVWEYADGKPNDFVPRYNKASGVKN